MESTKSYYITTAIAYTNGLPHIGFAYELAIADFLAKANKMLCKDVFLLTGTDEHGQKIQKTADEKNRDVYEFVTEIALKFKELCNAMNIDYDRFIRTTDKDHIQIVQNILTKIYDNGDIYKDKYEGYYCMYDERFFPESQLINGNMCPVCNRETRILQENAYFFKLSEYREKIIAALENDVYRIVPLERKNEILSRLKNDELKDLSITRLKANVSWGIDFPLDDSLIIYVWFDALINYITGARFGGTDFEKLWPCDIHNIGTDILWFHSVIWPAMLMSAKIPLPKNLLVHGYILDKNGEKMSKSKGNVTDPNQIIDKYNADVMRYYLLRATALGNDLNFNESDLVKHYNGELADCLGNLISRMHTMLAKYQNGDYSAEEYTDTLFDIAAVKEKIAEQVENFEVKGYIDHVFELISLVNKFITDAKPWELSPEQRKTVLYKALDHIRMLNILIKPILPQTHERINKQLGLNNCKNIKDFTIGKLFNSSISQEKKILFPKIEYAQKTLPIKLINGRIKSVSDHPEADKLYVLKVDVGNDIDKQLVAGIKPYYTKEDLIGKQIIVVDNLKHAKLRGVISEGMLLAVDKDGKVELLHSEDDSVGRIASIDGYELDNKTITIDEFAKISLSVMDKKLHFAGSELKINNKNIVSNTIENSDSVR